MILERGLEHRPTIPEPLDEPVGVGVGGHAGGHSPISLEDLFRAGEAVAGEVGGEEAVGGGLGGVELLRVGRVAQELPQPGRLGPGRAERVERRLFIGAERARRPGRVEDSVVGSAEKAPDPHPRLVADDRGGEELPSRGPGLLGRGERGREDDGRRVEDGGVVQVVLLDDVRGCAVDERGEERRGAPARGQVLARPPGGAHLARETSEGADRPLVPAREGGSHPVQKELLGTLDGLAGDVLVAEPGQEGGKLARRRGPGHAHVASPRVGLAISGACPLL